MDFNHKFDKCPLSGYKIRNQGPAIEVDSHFFMVDIPYLDTPLYYGITSEFYDFIYRSLSQKQKDMIWCILLERMIYGKKTFVIGTESVKSKSYETKHWILYSYKDILALYPRQNQIIDRILGFFVRMGEIDNEFLWSTVYVPCLNPMDNQNWEPFFNRERNVVINIINEMSNNGLLNVEDLNSQLITTITLKGIESYNGNNLDNESKMCFVAMKFGKGDDNCDMIEFCNTIIKPAVAETGYYAEIVSDTPSDQKICDKVIADIRKAKFIIVDLTHGNQGAYYEAGFAQALNKTVIYICEKKWFQDGNYKVKDGEDIYTIQTNGKPLGVHFDIDHYNIIQYDARNYDKLKEELIAHINARVIR